MFLESNVKRLYIGVIAALSLLMSASAVATNFTNGFVNVSQLYLYGKGAQFYLSDPCPSTTKNYYSLSSTYVDVNLYYSTLLAALTTGKTVKVGWEYDSTNTHCVVRRLDFK